MVFSHGWPLSAAAWEDQCFLASLGYRCIAHVIMRGDDDQIVPIGDSAMLSSKIVKGSMLKVYAGLPHGMCKTHKETINEDLLAFIKS